MHQGHTAAAMRHYLDLPTMKERHKMAQVQAYLRVSADETNPLHEKVGRVVTSRLKRGTEWMLTRVGRITKKVIRIGLDYISNI